MAEYGAPFDLRRLPDPMFHAHLAILKGRSDRRNEEAPDEGDVPDGAGSQGVAQHGYRQ